MKAQPQSTGPAPKKSSIIQKAQALSEAAIRWRDAGYPTRKPQKVLELYAVCTACPLFRPGKGPGVGECGACGCATNADGWLLNKLAWHTESCPADPPKWVDPYVPPQEEK